MFKENIFLKIHISSKIEKTYLLYLPILLVWFRILKYFYTVYTRLRLKIESRIFKADI